MPKKFPNDLWYFDSFDKALDKANELIDQHPKSEFEILYSSTANNFELWLDRYSIRGDFPELFGPGDIPGYLTDGDIDAISELCKIVPEGDFLEVGSFLGKSSAEWAKHLSGKVFCVDSFNSPIEFLRELLHNADFDIPPGENQLEVFEHYTQQYKNIVAVQGFFNQDFVWNSELAGVFEDSDHQLSTISTALPFWWNKLKQNGILSGHDYNDDVKQAVDLFAAENNLTVNTCKNSSIWYIIKQ